MSNKKSLDSENGKTNTIKMVGIAVATLIAIIVITILVKYKVPFKHSSTSLNIGFEDVGDLVTQTAFVRVLEDSSDSRKTPIFKKIIPGTTSRLIVSYMIKVEASIDFEKISIKSIDDNSKKIVIQLPHATVHSSLPVPDSFKNHLEQKNPFSDIDATEMNELLKDATEEGKNDAISNGLLEKADENGKVLLESFIRGNKEYKDFTVEFEYIEGE